MSETGELDCVHCGSCCFGHKVRLEPVDEARLSADEVLSLTQLFFPYGDDELDDAERIMRWAEGSRACVALRIEGDRYLCSIYERRPDVCRVYVSGGRRCLDWRERWGAPGAPRMPPPGQKVSGS